MSASSRRFLLVTAAAACGWTAVISITGGFVLRSAWFTASSRNPRGPITVALVVSAWYVLRHRRHWSEDAAWLGHSAFSRTVAAGAAAAALVIGFGWGSFVGGGPDASGYVSQADMWARGVLTLTPPAWARNAPWPYGVWSSSPIGYGPTYDGQSIAPMYSPGLPMMMALFQIAGGRAAVYVVVPLLGAVAVWGTYLLGRCMSGGWAGAIAAALLVCSPPFLWMLIQPMSDVPVTACWAMALVFALGQRRSDALVAGIATAAAVLVRPNVAPLAIVPAVLLLASREDRVRRGVLFAIAPAAAASVIAALNWYLNGSPLRSGYGSLSQIYEAQRIPVNLKVYTGWLVQTQTPLIFAGLLAPLITARGAGRHRVVLLTVVYPLLVLGLYLPYITFDHWPFLRFLLPAYPAVLAGVGAVIAALSRRSKLPIVALASVGLVAVVAVHEWQVARRENTFQIATFDRRYARVVDYVNRLPHNAVIVSNVHSGTLRFYTGRDVLRFEVMRPEDVDPALAYLHGLGHPLYFIGEPDEVDYFRNLFGATRAAGQLARAPIADLTGVVVYELK